MFESRLTDFCGFHSLEGVDRGSDIQHQVDENVTCYRYMFFCIIPPGLRDYSPFFSLHTALDFWEAVQPAKLREYMWNLASRAGENPTSTEEIYYQMRIRDDTVISLTNSILLVAIAPNLLTKNVMLCIFFIRRLPMTISQLSLCLHFISRCGFPKNV